MIPEFSIRAWRAVAPWQDDDQVEHDLLLSKAMVDIFSDDYLAETLALRGGTALQKLFFTEPLRFSEDIDLVQIVSVPEAKVMFQRLRAVLEPWLGEAKYKQSGNMMTLYFRFKSQIAPVVQRKLKVEIQCREHFTVLGLEHREFAVKNTWYSGSTRVPVYQLDELMGTKLRALYQRKKGRDLFDFWTVLTKLEVQPERILECFRAYMKAGTPSLVVTPGEIIRNVESKLEDRAFTSDMVRLLPHDATFDAKEAWQVVAAELFPEGE